MTGNELFREIGNIREEYIVEAEQFQGKSAWKKGTEFVIGNASMRKKLTAAACFCTCLGLVFLVQKTGIGFDQAKTESIKEAAFDGEMYQEASKAPESNAMETKKESIKAECAEEEKAVVNEVTEEMAEIESGTLSGKEESGNDSVVKTEEPLKSESIVKEYSVENVKERLAQYSNDYQTLLKEEGALVISMGSVQNGQDKWDVFLEQATAGEVSQIDVIVFTKEGDAIIRNVYFDGETYHLCVDKTRDAYAGVGADLYYEDTFRYLECVEEVWEDGTKVLEYVLTNELTGEELMDTRGFIYSLYQLYP